MHKVVTRECFHYRKLCDQPVVKEGEAAPEGNAVPYDLDVLAKGTEGSLFCLVAYVCMLEVTPFPKDRTHCIFASKDC